MCKHNCRPGIDCAHDREGDTWIVSDRTTPPGTARPADLPASQPEGEHEPTVTDSALAATLRRDGDADRYCDRGSCSNLDGHEGECTR